MATITADLQADVDLYVVRILWETMTTTNDVGEGVKMGAWADRSVQVVGTFDAAVVTIEGSNDGGTTYAALKDGQGVAVTFSTTGLKTIADLPYHIRPRITTAGSGGADLDVYLMARAVYR